ncbi:MAG TPA: DUF58 domain-containing protein [Polyangia bacterium]|nr:DUF58 domain-containing protein [Polyangia bacterium]
MTLSAFLGRVWTWLKPRRRFPPTREGWWFLMATLLIGLAAINAGLNLLFLVWGMMLCLILASGVLSELCLRSLEVRRSPPTNIHARAPYLMGIALTNGKRRIPSFSVEVEDLMDGRPIEKRCYFLKLPAGRTQETAYRHMMPRRGRQHLSGLRLSTKFPFGLIQKSRDVTDPAELIIYPALVPVPDQLLRGLPAEHGRGRMRWRSRGGDFFGLRDFRHGDDPRDIHWRTSARRGMPFVRENEDDEGLTATVLFDNSMPGTADDGGSPEAFEEAVSLAASVSAELLRRGYRVTFLARGLQIAGARGPGQNTRIMRALALIDVASAGADAANNELPTAPGPCIRIRPGRPAEAQNQRGTPQPLERRG